MYIEGLIHVSKIPGDYYIFDEQKGILIGKRTHKIYKICQDIVIKVSRVDLENTHVDFELYDPNQKSSDNKKHSDDPSKDKNSRKRKPRKKPIFFKFNEKSIPGYVGQRANTSCRV